MSSLLLAGVGNAGVSYSQKLLGISPANLLAYWKLDETSGATAYDSSGNGRNGTISGATLGAAGIGDGLTAMSFDGVNDFINIYSASLSGAYMPNSMTILAWCKIPSAVWSDSAERQLLYFESTWSGNRLGILKQTDNKIYLFTQLGGVLNDTLIRPTSDTAWACVAVTFDSTQKRTYYNGVQITSYNVGTHGANPLALATIGAQSLSGVVPFKGDIAHVAIWNTPLSAAQIATLAAV